MILRLKANYSGTKTIRGELAQWKNSLLNLIWSAVKYLAFKSEYNRTVKNFVHF